MKIEIKNLSKEYDQNVLKNISLKDEVKTLALIGKSGCGKSTFLRIMGGLIEKTSGEIFIDEEEVTDSVDYRRKMGFVFQQGGLFAHMSAIDNIALPLVEVHGFTKEKSRERAVELLKRFGLESQMNKFPSELSGGQKQRISIARAIAPKPKILFLDEPTSALDPEYTTEVLTIINELKEEDLSFVIATHEMGFALHSCEKVAFLDGGEIIEYGKSEDIFNNPQTEQLQQFLSKLLKWKV